MICRGRTVSIMRVSCESGGHGDCGVSPGRCPAASRVCGDGKVKLLLWRCMESMPERGTHTPHTIHTDTDQPTPYSRSPVHATVHVSRDVTGGTLTWTLTWSSHTLTAPLARRSYSCTRSVLSETESVPRRRVVEVDMQHLSCRVHGAPHYPTTSHRYVSYNRTDPRCSLQLRKPARRLERLR